jgi:hypothetical protein
VQLEQGFAGPQSIDLREHAAAELGGQPMGRVGSRDRSRHSAGDGTLTAPLAGWVDLRWGDEPSFAALGLAERFHLLDRQMGLPPAGDHLLLLADRPMQRYARVRDSGRAAEDARRLLAVLGDKV